MTKITFLNTSINKEEVEGGKVKIDFLISYMNRNVSKRNVTATIFGWIDEKFEIEKISLLQNNPGMLEKRIIDEIEEEMLKLTAELLEIKKEIFSEKIHEMNELKYEKVIDSYVKDNDDFHYEYRYKGGKLFLRIIYSKKSKLGIRLEGFEIEEEVIGSKKNSSFRLKHITAKR